MIQAQYKHTTAQNITASTEQALTEQPVRKALVIWRE
jgi:hypothetical protein